MIRKGRCGLDGAKSRHSPRAKEEKGRAQEAETLRESHRPAGADSRVVEHPNDQRRSSAGGLTLAGSYPLLYRLVLSSMSASSSSCLPPRPAPPSAKKHLEPGAVLTHRTTLRPPAHRQCHCIPSKRLRLLAITRTHVAIVSPVSRPDKAPGRAPPPSDYRTQVAGRSLRLSISSRRRSLVLLFLQILSTRPTSPASERPFPTSIHREHPPSPVAPPKPSTSTTPIVASTFLQRRWKQSCVQSFLDPANDDKRTEASTTHLQSNSTARRILFLWKKSVRPLTTALAASKPLSFHSSLNSSTEFSVSSPVRPSR
jgi:hypothetical protein